MSNSLFTDDQLFDILIKDAEHSFSGWDFSYIKHRLVESPLTWSYHSIILPYVRMSKAMLDMGTGGGEFLSSLQPLPKNTCATEAYKPNIPIAQKNLEPLGAKVFEIEEYAPLPFKDMTFDLVINRHEWYDSSEVYRILKSGGYFITQQVGGQNDIELNRFLDAKIPDDYLEWNLEFVVKQLREAGFSILEKNEVLTTTRCFDIGALVYYLKAIPWQIEDFTVEKYSEKLKKLHKKILRGKYFEMTNHRLYVISKKEK